MSKLAARLPVQLLDVRHAGVCNRRSAVQRSIVPVDPSLYGVILLSVECDMLKSLSTRRSRLVIVKCRRTAIKPAGIAATNSVHKN